MTSTTRGILGVLLESAPEPVYGGELPDHLAVSHGSVYNAIYRLEAAGWVLSHWEADEKAIEAGRRRRRYYSLNPTAVPAVRAAVEDSGRRWASVAEELGLA